MTTAATTAGKCKINYVYVEMVLNKDSKYDVIAGLFKGMVEMEDQKFILLQGLKNSTNVLCLDFYNLLMLEVREGDYKNFMFLENTETDQKDGLEELEKVYKTLTDADLVVANDKQIIDIDQYTEVPKDYLDGKPINSGTAQSGTASGVGNFQSPHQRYNQGNTYTKQTTVKADPTPGLISRTKTKKPTKTLLQTMYEKVQQIQSGEFEPNIPAIMGADDTGETEKEDDVYGYGNGYGSFC